MGKRFIAGPEGLHEVPLEPESDAERENWELTHELEEIKKQMQDPKLGPDRLAELWKKQRRIEKKLGLSSDEEGKELPTGVYL